MANLEPISTEDLRSELKSGHMHYVVGRGGKKNGLRAHDLWKLLDAKKDDYVNLLNRDQKRAFIEHIVATITQHNGRFLREHPDEDGMWIDVLDEAKIIKTIQKALTDRMKGKKREDVVSRMMAGKKILAASSTVAAAAATKARKAAVTALKTKKVVKKKGTTSKRKTKGTRGRGRPKKQSPAFEASAVEMAKMIAHAAEQPVTACWAPADEDRPLPLLPMLDDRSVLDLDLAHYTGNTGMEVGQVAATVSPPVGVSGFDASLPPHETSTSYTDLDDQSLRGLVDRQEEHLLNLQSSHQDLLQELDSVIMENLRLANWLESSEETRAWCESQVQRLEKELEHEIQGAGLSLNNNDDNNDNAHHAHWDDHRGDNHHLNNFASNGLMEIEV